MTAHGQAPVHTGDSLSALDDGQRGLRAREICSPVIGLPSQPSVVHQHEQVSLNLEPQFGLALLER